MAYCEVKKDGTVWLGRKGAEDEGRVVGAVSWVIQHSISQANRTTLCNGVTYEVYGKLVIVHAYNITLSGDLRKVGTMPSGLCPRATVYGVINTESYAGIIYINSNGDVLFWARNKGDYTGQIIYTV